MVGNHGFRNNVDLNGCIAEVVTALDDNDRVFVWVASQSRCVKPDCDSDLHCCVVWVEFESRRHVPMREPAS